MRPPVGDSFFFPGEQQGQIRGRSALAQLMGSRGASESRPGTRNRPASLRIGLVVLAACLYSTPRCQYRHD